jgi:hypothetical protein
MEGHEIPTIQCRSDDDNLPLTMDTSNKRYKICPSDAIANVDNNNHEVLSSHETTSTLPTTSSANDGDNNNNKTILRSSNNPPPPKYGSIQYWNERYQKQFQRIGAVKVNENHHHNNDTTTDNNINNIKIGNKDDITTLPYHSWYFTYDELRPILLPLLLGGGSDMIEPYSNTTSDIENEQLPLPPTGNAIFEINHREIDQETGPSENASIENRKLRDTNSHDNITNGNVQDEEVDEVDDDDEEEEDKKEDEEVDDNEDEGEWEEVVDEDEDDENVIDDSETDDVDDDEIPAREGLAKGGPVSILEIGCGDVPLGAALAYEFRDICIGLLPTTTTTSNQDDNKKLSIITKILCTDYSPVVVAMMRKQFCNVNDVLDQTQILTAGNDTDTAVMSTMEIPKDVIETRPVGSVPLQFELMDARRIPRDDNSFHLIIEKGTLDAVLSDPVNGVSDCVQIVSECARVVSGCIVLVSHLNAHTPNGLGWLEEVVMEGLKKYSIRLDSNVAAWDIEVHGNSDVIDDDEKNGSFPPGSTGPAVYVIHKGMKQQQLDEPSPSITVTKLDGTHESVNDSTSSIQDDVDIVPINVQFFSY